MAESTYQAQARRNRQLLRAVRRQYRQADSAGEKLERELDRLINRKTLVQRKSFETGIRLYDTYAKLVWDLAKTFADAVSAASI
jgi:hypothetical protein